MIKNKNTQKTPTKQLTEAQLPSETQLLEGKASDKAYLKQQDENKHTRDKFINKQRRGFLSMLSKAGLSLPALKASSFLAGTMASRYALAQGAVPKKIVMVYVPQGAPADQWLPDSASATKHFSRPYGDYGVADLMGFRHVDVLNESHSMAYNALGDPTYGSKAPTFDMRVSEVLGATTPYRMMYLGADALRAIQVYGERDSRLLCSRAGLPINGPAATLNRFFKNVPSPPNDTGPQQMIDAQRLALEELRQKLGMEEYQRIDEHLSGISNLSKRLIVSDDTPAPECGTPKVDMNGETLRQGYAQAELIASAFSCGLTNVAVLQVGDGGGYYTMPGHYGGEVHAGGSHSGNYNDFRNCGYGHQTVPAKMLQLLRDTPDADGAPLIDSTLFVISNCMGDGRTHTSHASPWGFATRLPGFQNGFSRGNGGNCKDFFSAIPIGLGLEHGTYMNAPGNPEAANILV